MIILQHSPTIASLKFILTALSKYNRIQLPMVEDVAGALAEYVVVNEGSTVSRPPELAGLKLDGTGLEVNVLVTAASGGVGQYAVQLLKLANAHITATFGARNMDLVRSLGADEVLDYKTPNGVALKSPSGRKYDRTSNSKAEEAWAKSIDGHATGNILVEP
ncbi:hypothetical protein GOBAR_DD27401 [Gossypium barbadense]|nr:hypothetical protein GOBAR_DD27401 [Gossypium barbadense]